jgi:thiosulfate dehydrogenase
MTSAKACLAAGLVAFCATACVSSDPLPVNQKTRYPLVNGLVPARMTMVTAWDYPRNPLTDPGLDDSTLSKEIKWGYRLFTDTPAEAPQFAPGKGSCNNCHMNAGQRERAMPLVGVAGMFPEYNRRGGRLISLGDRVVECFLRSQNATGRLPADTNATSAANASGLPTPASREVLALSAYITWLSNGAAMGRNPAWRGQNTIAQAALVPLDKLDPAKGEQIYAERCTSCHGADGQGVQIDNKKAGPLWGPDSWNDGAGAARIYTLAGIIRYSMPYLDPGNMTDADAQHLSAYINSKPRPAYPFKALDYPKDPVPVDAVYYPKKNK